MGCLTKGLRLGLGLQKTYGINRNLFLSAINFQAEKGSKDHIAELVKNNDVVVFMKGVPEAPKCGFSNAVVQILKMHGIDKYDHHNVLEDEKIRQGIKDYSNWPTIPQIYMKGEFVGGCDIMIQMHQNGELIEQLNKIGITSALIETKKSQK